MVLRASNHQYQLNGDIEIESASYINAIGEPATVKVINNIKLNIAHYYINEVLVVLSGQFIEDVLQQAKLIKNL